MLAPHNKKFFSLCSDSVVTQNIQQQNLIKMFVYTHPFPMHPPFSPSTLLRSLFCGVQLFMKLHYEADHWSDPTLKSHKKISSGGEKRKNKTTHKLFFLLLFSCSFCFCFFVCKPRHHLDHDPPANTTSTAAGTSDRTLQSQLHPPSSTIGTVAPSWAPQGVVFCRYSN